MPDANQSVRIIVIGNGQIGAAIAQDCSSRQLMHWTRDIDELSAEIIGDFQPTHVINAAGKTDLAWCEAHPAETYRSNLEAPVRLYERILGAEAAHYIHFSSGCVWDGPYSHKGNPFEPQDPVSPQALYSWTKAACDAMLLQRNRERVSILRPRQVYSELPNPRNTLSKLLRYPGLINAPQSMSSLNVIRKTISYLLHNASDVSGIWNVYDKGVISPFEVGNLLAARALREKPKKITKADLDSWHKPKRVDVVLHDARFESRIMPQEIRAELETVIENFARNLASH